MNIVHIVYMRMLVGVASAQSFITDGIPGCDDLTTTGAIDPGQCIPSFLAHVIKTIFGFTGGFFLIMILWAAYEIILGSLPGGSAESGKNRITWAIIGFIMCATAFFIMDFILSAIGG
ncbi:hypothetical protein FJZ28_03200 [Candidatus Peregrinibacteria bacterium]|nr:hypothetical protein [Candidatus Peregrinibacteria bacterium]